ncbi:MAG: GerMN domain-containing protein [Actinomycetota bacterium]
MGRPRPRSVAILVAVALSFAGCAISEDATPRDIPVDQRSDFGAIATGDEATGVNRIYLLAPGDDQVRLRSVARGAATTPEALLDSLVSGPNEEELNQQLQTALPSDLEVLSRPRSVGFVLTIDVNDALSTLASDGLTLALAQIVATVTELDTVERVRLRVEGQSRAWPTGDGRLSTDPLSVYDYPNLIESTQPALPSLPSS